MIHLASYVIGGRGRSVRFRKHGDQNHVAKTSSEQLLQELLLQANAELTDDRRAEPRLPFFRAVSVRVESRSYSAFIREISLSSIGMLHNMQLPLEEVTVTVAGQRRGISCQNRTMRTVRRGLVYQRRYGC